MEPVQPALLDLPVQPVQEVRPSKGRPKLRVPNRQQITMVNIDLEDLIPGDHRARAIWDLAGKLDLTGFVEPLRTTVGDVGRPAWDPQLLVSLWVYAYSEGISSAREIERVMAWEPGMQWLSGMETINHHTLSDFRVEHKAALDRLFAQLLALLETAGLVSLEQVMHDGTKIRAQAGGNSFRKEKNMRERLEQARQAVEQMGDPRTETPQRDRRQAAQQRAARERAERLEAAVKEMEALQAEEQKDEDKAKVKVSEQEPEARRMKHGDNAIVPSYNAQISTEASHTIIVGIHLSQCSSDANSLPPALEKVKENLGRQPQQVVVDGGFTNRKTIVECERQGIDLVGSLADPEERSAAAMKAAGIAPEFAPGKFRILENRVGLECPAGCVLKPLRKNRKRGDLYQQYRAEGKDCLACPYQKECCPRNAAKGRTVSIRVEEQAEVARFREKMKGEDYRQIYRKRAGIAEFPNAWLKEKIGLRKFRVRGLVKAGAELVWACLTYNILQWIRLGSEQVAA